MSTTTSRKTGWIVAALTAAFLLWPRRSSGAINWNNAQPSQYFTWDEVQTTTTGLPNDIPDELRPNAALLGQLVLDPIRDYIDMPLYVNSWYRSDDVNNAVGGSDESMHRLALAADVEVGTNSMNVAIMRAAIALRLPFNQLIAYGSWDAPTRVHIDFGGEENPRREVGLKTASGYTWISFADAAARYL